MNLLQALAGAAAGVLAAGAAAAAALRSPPPSLVRTNFRGARVPAVLGLPLVVGTVAGVFGVVFAASAGGSGVDGSLGRRLAAVLACAVPMYLGGLADDRRGDEADRGFGGHLAALRAGRVTGGTVKIAAGGVAGLAAAALAGGGVLRGLETVLLVALTANLFNLLDRAPGRAAKVGWALIVPLAAADPAWALAAGGALGALVVVTPLDLRERGMLGDAGSNPLGAVVGLGLAGLAEPWRGAAAVAVLALNLASERVSFSQVIERNRWLGALDRLGRPGAK